MENNEKVEKKFYKKIWFWVLVIIILAGLGAMVGGDENNTNKIESTENKKSGKVEVVVADFSTMPKEEIENWCNTNKIKYTIVEEYSDTAPKGQFVSQSANANSTIHEGDKITIRYSLGKEPTTEYKNALKKAESYSKTMHMSKKGIYHQLTSQYGEKFSADAAQYAIDNMQVDWKANALAKAKSYQTTMNMSKSRIYDQLISEYGEKFTKEEAQYAIDHLDD